MFKILH